jgi:hypothetical protein
VGSTRRKTPEASCVTYEKAQSRLRWDEQYILRRFATRLLGLRWGFEITSKKIMIKGEPHAKTFTV